MNSQNYKKYSKSELEEIIKNTNKDLYPKRYKQVELLIKDFQKREESKQKESRVEKKLTLLVGESFLPLAHSLF